MWQKMLQVGSGGSEKITSHIHDQPSGFASNTTYTITTGFKPTGIIMYYLNGVDNTTTISRWDFNLGESRICYYGAWSKEYAFEKLDMSCFGWITLKEDGYEVNIGGATGPNNTRIMLIAYK